MNSTSRDFGQKKRIVVKVGSSTISHATGKLNYRRMEHLVRELADLQNQGKQMILVSSGATNAGMAPLHMDHRPRSIREKQALAAVGQGVLMHTYERLFREYGQVVGQVLLTRMDSQDRSKFMNSRNALLTMLDMGVIPIINEKDELAGIVTDADLLYKKVKPHVPHYVNLLGASIYYNGISEYDKGFKKLMACTAKDMMTKDVIIAAPDAEVEQIACVMVAEHLKVIPIVKEKHIVGIVTRGNILDELYREYGDD